MDDDEDAGSTTTTNSNNYKYEVVNLSIAHNVDLVAPISRHNSIQLREIMAAISEFREVMMQRVDGNKVSLKFLPLLLLMFFFTCIKNSRACQSALMSCIFLLFRKVT